MLCYLYGSTQLMKNSRRRRKKCDETRPNCKICVERGVECVYPDWSMVKYARTRQRIIQSEKTGSRVSPPLLMAAQPSSGQSRLLYHFQTSLSNLISFSSQGGSSNPFLIYVLPLALSSIQVQRAIEAVAAAHLHVLGVESPAVPTNLHTQALNLLAAEVCAPQQDHISRRNSLVGSLLLIYYEACEFHLDCNFRS